MMISTIGRIAGALFLFTILVSQPADAQELPSSAVSSVLEHLVEKAVHASEIPVVIVDRFPGSAAASQAARRLGVQAGTTAELMSCDDVERRCRLLHGERALKFAGAAIHQGRWHVRVIESREFDDGEGPRTFSQLREVVLEARGDGWAVVEDRIVFRS